ncbi:arginine metabolism regulation protein II [Fusarium piperis]|uniref:Arginine metabolism regulation protein II n=1 Tax=Fusarium piperis TaxID=1435070 RepID=A0A9W9BNA5_9HYPO|nr:arginine metabolism regulation protein II [Fusarium piperis]
MSRLPPRFIRNPPGSSCTTCRRRRIHCDRARPNCTQCTSRARICPGYAAGLRWVPDAHLPARTPTGPPSETASEDSSLLICYFEHAAPVMGIFHDCRNPFGESLRQGILDKNKTLRHAAMAIAAMQQAGRDGSYLQYAWRHRATACRLLNKDLDTRQGRLPVLSTVILLGLTEACFDMKNSLPFHVRAARALLSEMQRLGYLVPPVLCNAVLWMEVQVSFVYDCPPDIEAVNGGSLPQATADPFLINTAWEPLFRQIALAGALTTHARQRSVTEQTQDAAREPPAQLCVRTPSHGLTVFTWEKHTG